MFLDAGRFGRDFHVGRDDPSASWLQTPLARDLDQADSTRSDGREAVIVAERRDFHLGPIGDLKDRFAREGFDGLAVEFD